MSHVLVDCRDYEVERARYLPGAPSLEDLLGESRTADVSKLVEFLNAINFHVIYSPGGSSS